MPSLWNDGADHPTPAYRRRSHDLRRRCVLSRIRARRGQLSLPPAAVGSAHGFRVDRRASLPCPSPRQGATLVFCSRGFLPAGIRRQAAFDLQPELTAKRVGEPSDPDPCPTTSGGCYGGRGACFAAEPSVEVAPSIARSARISCETTGSRGRSSVDDVEARWRLHLQPFSGSLLSTRVTSSLPKTHVDRRQADGAANGTRNRRMSSQIPWDASESLCSSPRVAL